MRKKNSAQQIQKLFKNLFFKFKNYTQNQKLLSLFLIFFTFCILILPIVKYTPLNLENDGGQKIRLLGRTYFKSFLLIGISLLFLLGWNLNTRFKQRIINLTGLRESEPLVNFGFFWLITSAMVGISDTLGVISQGTSTISFTPGGKFIFVLLLIGVIITFIDLWKAAQKNSQKTKILNIVDDEGEKQRQNKKEIKHLFGDDFEE